MVDLTLSEIGHAYERRVLFRRLNAAARSGERLAITGPNGSGKSTLVRIIAGLTRPGHGESVLRQDGQPLAGADRRAAIGLVSPALALYDELTAGENLELFGRLRGLRLAPADHRTLLERVGLRSDDGTRVRAFSSGMRQRLKYAFALQGRPALLLLDEPAANLDADGAAMARQVMDEQRRRGIVVIATNEAAEAAECEHRIDLGGAESAAGAAR